jgi:hypothetical protein
VDPLVLHWNSPLSVTVHPYAGEEWRFGKEQPRKKTAIAEFQDCRIGIGGDVDRFIQQVRSELSVVFPANSPTHGQLAVDFRALIQKKTGRAPHRDGSDLRDPELRTEFQLR